LRVTFEDLWYFHHPLISGHDRKALLINFRFHLISLIACFPRARPSVW
jgi:hypothetical protein